ncbi:MAG: class I SAM-dependent methyltransferase [Candidatus Acidiferrum sp.]|jgi:SAM-dependent methyltransferase
MSTTPITASNYLPGATAIRHCRLCMNSGALAVLLDSGDSRLLKCAHCGVTMLDPAPTEAELAAHFVDHYITDDERLEKTFEKTREVILAQVARNVLHRKEGGNILDIGCAGGYFLNRFFSRLGWTRYGLEPSRYATHKAEEKGIRMYQGQVLSVDLPAGHFDVVTAMDVFCYFRDPQLELRAIHKAMKPDGLLLIELPLAETQLLRNTGRTALLAGGPGRLLTKCGHLFFFNRSSMEFLLERTGFHVEAFLPVPANRQGHFYKDMAFRTYFLASRLLWYLSARKFMLGPNFLVVASLKSNISNHG